MYKQFIKRFLDFLIAFFALPFVVMVIIPVAIAIKIEDGGRIFYCGQRLGKNGVAFKMFKFRSMKENSPDIRLEDGSTYNGEDDPRVTKVGAFLRKTSIDEIPQFLNILIGNMSLVGPRPDTVDMLEKYTEDEKIYLSVRPGITGYNQAYFRNSIDGKEKLSNDVFYAKNISMWFDIKIFFKTFITVFKKENVYITNEKTTNIDMDNTNTDVETLSSDDNNFDKKD